MLYCLRACVLCWCIVVYQTCRSERLALISSYTFYSFLSSGFPSQTSISLCKPPAASSQQLCHSLCSSSRSSRSLATLFNPTSSLAHHFHRPLHHPSPFCSFASSPLGMSAPPPPPSVLPALPNPPAPALTGVPREMLVADGTRLKKKRGGNRKGSSNWKRREQNSTPSIAHPAHPLTARCCCLPSTVSSRHAWLLLLLRCGWL